MSDYNVDWKRARELWDRSGAPARHGERKELAGTPEFFKVKSEALHVAFHGGIGVLLGARGTGKTQIAVEAIRELCKAAKPCMYVRCQEIFMDMRSTFRDDSRMTEAQVVARYCKPHLLVIDEAHCRRHNEFENTALDLIVDRRYGDGRSTIFIANATAQAFRNQIGETVWDRLAEKGAVWNCNWKSFRVED